MSSTERAPEPTMEDILASIRRIITDDEAGQPTSDKPEQKAQSEDEKIEGEADNQIIDDIARVLGESGDAPAGPADEDEEILDLTAELGGLEIIEEEEVVQVVEVPEVAEVPAVEETAPPATGPVFVAEPAADDQPPALSEPLAEPPAEPVLDAGAQSTAPEELSPVAETPLPEAPVPPAQEPVSAVPESTLAAGEEAASALERAIAALKAGQVPSATDAPAEPFQFQPPPQAETEIPSEAALGPEVIPMAVPMSEPTPEASTHLDPETQESPSAETNFEVEPTPSLEPLEEDLGAEAELVLTEVGAEDVALEEPISDTMADTTAEKPSFWPPQADEERIEEPVMEDPAMDEPSFAAPAEAEVSFTPEPELPPQSSPVVGTAEALAGAPANGAVADHDEGAARTLEDSIKDMLRPMLRQWLDENMPRMIREELDEEALRRRRD